jgi:UDP-N-acetyl-D-mannosaminuronate dehydrogenase
LHTVAEAETIKIIIEAKNAKVGVVGLVFVGLPLAIEKAKVVLLYLYLNADKAYEQVNRDENYISVCLRP